LKKFLITHAEKIGWVDQEAGIEPQFTSWIHKNLPKFEQDYSTTLYEYEEVQKYLKNLPKRETEKIEGNRGSAKL
jgi:hypothetical protein